MLFSCAKVNETDTCGDNTESNENEDEYCTGAHDCDTVS